MLRGEYYKNIITTKSQTLLDGKIHLKKVGEHIGCNDVVKNKKFVKWCFGNDQEPFSCMKRNKAGKEFKQSRELTNANNILDSNKTEWPTNQPNENIMQRKKQYGT